jgi:hypothetical protein
LVTVDHEDQQSSARTGAIDDRPCKGRAGDPVREFPDEARDDDGVYTRKRADFQLLRSDPPDPAFRVGEQQAQSRRRTANLVREHAGDAQQSSPVASDEAGLIYGESSW